MSATPRRSPPVGWDALPPPAFTERPSDAVRAAIGPNGCGLRVKGESMVGVPEKPIHDGDTVWFDPDEPPRPCRECVVVAIIRERRHGRRVVVVGWADADGVLCTYPVGGSVPLRERAVLVMQPAIALTRPPRIFSHQKMAEAGIAPAAVPESRS